MRFDLICFIRIILWFKLTLKASDWKLVSRICTMKIDATKQADAGDILIKLRWATIDVAKVGLKKIIIHQSFIPTNDWSFISVWLWICRRKCMFVIFYRNKCSSVLHKKNVIEFVVIKLNTFLYYERTDFTFRIWGAKSTSELPLTQEPYDFSFNFILQ